MTEQWRSVPSEPHYEVSNLGRVRSLDHVITCRGRNDKIYTRFRHGRMLRGAIQSTGYIDITVDSTRHRNGKRVPRRRSVASMVLEAFVGPRPSPIHQTRHLDDNRTNNVLENLAWGSPLDNGRDKARNGHAYRPIGTLHHNAKLTEAKVRRLRAVYRRYGTKHIRLAKRFGISASTAHQICTGKGWRHVQ